MKTHKQRLQEGIEMSKITPLLKVTRPSLIKALLYYKRIIRLQLHLQNLHSDRIASIGRSSQLLKAKNSPFDRHRINQAEQSISSICEQRKEACVDLNGSGQFLKSLVQHADRILSFHDKCQLLNVSHIAALKALGGDKKISFEKMIFVHVLEYRGNEEMLPFDDISMPYWWALYHRSIHELENNLKLRLEYSLIFDEMLSEAGQCPVHDKPDCSKKNRQVSSHLRVVK